MKSLKSIFHEPIWLTKNEIASRLRRGRIETVIDYAKAKEYFEGDNPTKGGAETSHFSQVKFRSPNTMRLFP